MSEATVTEAQFEEAWEAAGDYRYVYVLNRGLLFLYGGLLSAFWIYFLITVLRDGFDLGLTVVCVVLGAVTGFVFVNTVYWRRYARVSGVVCDTERIWWRQGEKIHGCRWEDVDFDALGLTNLDLGEKKYEHFLTVAGKKLFLFRPHVRLRNMEQFMGSLLVQLKSRGLIPQQAGGRRKPKKRKKKRG